MFLHKLQLIVLAADTKVYIIWVYSRRISQYYDTRVVCMQSTQMWSDLGKPIYLLGTNKFLEKTQIKRFKNVFAHLDNTINMASRYEISQPKLIFPRRYGWLYQTNQCAEQVGQDSVTNDIYTAYIMSTLMMVQMFLCGIKVISRWLRSWMVASYFTLCI